MEYLKGRTISVTDNLELVEVKQKSSYNTDFIAKYENGKCIGVYLDFETMYPLVVAKEDEELKIFVFSSRNYILKYEKGICKSIYNSRGKELILATKQQELIIIGSNGKIKSSFGPFVEFFILIKEKGKQSILYELRFEKEVLTTCYKNSEIEISDKFYLEKQDGNIKAIFSKDGKLLLKSDSAYFELCQEIFVKEIFEDGKCHAIYYNDTKSDLSILCKNEEYDLSLLGEEHFYSNSNPVVIGKKDGKIKFVYSCNVSNKLKVSDINNYFEFEITFMSLLYVKEMYDGKCIKIYSGDYFVELFAINYNKTKELNCYFEIQKVDDNVFIKKIDNCKCKEIYSNNKLDVFTNEENVDITIYTHKKGQNILFLYMVGDKCISIKKKGECKKVLYGFLYEIHRHSDEKLLIYEKEEKRIIAIYDEKLERVLDVSNLDGASILIHSINTCRYVEYIYYFGAVVRYYDVITWLKVDSDDRCRAVYQGDKIILSAQNDEYFYMYGSYILKNDKNKCFAIYEVVNLGENVLIKNLIVDNKKQFYYVPFVSLYNIELFKEFCVKTRKELAIYIKCKDGFVRIASDYEKSMFWNDFLFLTSNDSKKITRINLMIEHGIYKSDEIISIYGGKLEFNFVNEKYIYISETFNGNVVKVYSLYGRELVPVGKLGTGIETLFLGNCIFFKEDDKVYNIIGNEV